MTGDAVDKAHLHLFLDAGEVPGSKQTLAKVSSSKHVVTLQQHPVLLTCQVMSHKQL